MFAEGIWFLPTHDVDTTDACAAPTYGLATADSDTGVPHPEPGDRVVRTDGSPAIGDRVDDLVVVNRRRMRSAMTVASAIAFVPFISVLWDFSPWPLRTAAAHRFASNFYDLQGRALLDGHLAVPAGSLDIEGFIVNGHTYMYFPPFPALLRMPVLAITDHFDGRMTAPSMLLAWLVLTASTALLLWRVRMLVRGYAVMNRLEAAALASFWYRSAAAPSWSSSVRCLGSTTRSILWADVLAMLTLAAAVGLLRRRTWRLAIIASFGALGTNLVRVTSGWAMSLMLIGLGLWFLTTQRREQTKTKSVGWTLLAGGTIAIAVGAMINWAKFRHPYMFPLRDQLWTAQNADRRLALAFNGGTLTGPQFFLTSLLNYFRPDGIRLVSYLPFITFPAQPARAYGGAFLDQMYRTGSVPRVHAAPVRAQRRGIRLRVPTPRRRQPEGPAYPITWCAGSHGWRDGVRVHRLPLHG